MPKLSILRLLVAAAAAALVTPAFAQRAVELVIPIAAGGALDAATRAVGVELAAKWKEPVVPANKPGAGMVLGVKYTLEQPADGRTIMVGGLPYTTAQFRPSGSPFNPDDMTPVAYMGWQGTVLYIRSTIPANTIAEFVQWAKQQPQGVSFASSGVGSSPHIGAEEFAGLTGIKITHVPYTGSGAFQPAIQGGHVDAVFDAPSSRVHVQSGKLKALMFGAKDPFPGWPELPTAPASGLPTFKSGSWYGFLVSAKTPAATVQKLNADLNEAMRTPAVRARLDQLGIQPGTGTADDFVKLLKSEHTRLEHVIRSRNIAIN
ncbi:Bug family tripartite tricarboxylate transporter substrate binding protein [Ramlibacter sp.]|uniref:Bug family tripartite tricarboxylate transporter substrate binding protein n=1 Tax=Ramlibacter sp. TaxID=1917967 RepID=UPI003D09C431